MIDISKYIFEKLIINDDTKLPKKSVRERVEELFIDDICQSNIKEKISKYRIEQRKGFVQIILPENAKIYLKQLADYITQELDKDEYNVEYVSHSLRDGTINIKTND